MLPEDEYRQRFMMGIQNALPGEAGGAPGSMEALRAEREQQWQEATGGNAGPLRSTVDPSLSGPTAPDFMQAMKAQREADYQADRARYAPAPEPPKSPTDPSIVPGWVPDIVKNAIEPNKAPAPDTYAAAVASQRAAQPQPAAAQPPPPEATQQQQAFTPQFRPPGSAFVKTGEQTQTQGGLESPYFKEADTSLNSAAIAGSERVDAEAEKIAKGNKVRANILRMSLDEVDDARIKMGGIESRESKRREEITRGAEELAKVENDYEGGMNIGQTIGFAIAAALQGYANGLMGKSGPNEMLQLMQQTMDRDFNIAKSNQAKKQRGLENRMALNERILSQFKDEKSQLSANRALQQEALQTRLESMLADQTLDADTRARVQGMREELYKSTAHEYANLGQLTGSRTSTSETRSRVSTGGGGAPAGMSKDLAERYVPAWGGVARSKEEAIKAREQSSMTTAIVDNLKAAKGRLGDIGTFDKVANKFKYQTDKVDLFRSEIDAALQPIVMFYGGGAMAEGERAAALKRIDGGLAFGANPQTLIDNEIRRIQVVDESRRRGMGVQSVQEGYAPTPMGTVAPVAGYTGRTQVPVPQVRKK